MFIVSYSCFTEYNILPLRVILTHHFYFPLSRFCYSRILLVWFGLWLLSYRLCQVSGSWAVCSYLGMRHWGAVGRLWYMWHLAGVCCDGVCSGLFCSNPTICWYLWVYSLVVGQFSYRIIHLAGSASLKRKVLIFCWRRVRESCQLRWVGRVIQGLNVAFYRLSACLPLFEIPMPVIPELSVWIDLFLSFLYLGFNLLGLFYWLSLFACFPAFKNFSVLFVLKVYILEKKYFCYFDRTLEINILHFYA